MLIHALYFITNLMAIKLSVHDSEIIEGLEISFLISKEGGSLMKLQEPLWCLKFVHRIRVWWKSNTICWFKT